MVRNVHGTKSPQMVRNVYGTNSLWYEKSGNQFTTLLTNPNPISNPNLNPNPNPKFTYLILVDGLSKRLLLNAPLCT